MRITRGKVAEIIKGLNDLGLTGLLTGQRSDMCGVDGLHG